MCGGVRSFLASPLVSAAAYPIFTVSSSTNSDRSRGDRKLKQRIEHIGPFEYRRFAAAVLPLSGSYDALTHDVVIVGGGPVGLSTALGLARRGVRSVVIEADDSVCEGSRAACISRRSLQIAERLGVVDDFLCKGLAWHTGRSFYRDQEVLSFSMPTDAKQKYPPMVNLQQYYIEQYLLDAVDRCNAASPGTIEMRWASTVSDLTIGRDEIGLTIDTAAQRYVCRARWVVACDGGQSFIRGALGQQLTGTGYEGRYAIIDIELPSDAPAERRAWFDPPWWRGSTILMHRQPDNIWRIDYQLRASDDPEAALRPDHVKVFVQRHLDAIGEGHLAWKPVWTSMYRAGAMTLASYRHGRVLFAGNAAHAMPIFGVRGLNSGFDDADNLAWKLAFVVRGQAPECLLDTYSSERIDAFHVNAANAMRSTEFMSPPSRGFDLMREACLSLAFARPDIARLVNPRQTQAITYPDSPLSTDGDWFGCGPEPGAPFQDVQAANGIYLSDVLDADAFTVLIFEDDGEVSEAMFGELTGALTPVHVVRIASRESAGRLVATLADPDRCIWEAYGARECTVYLMRPDGHVAARWHVPAVSAVQQAIRKACADEGAIPREMSNET